MTRHALACGAAIPLLLLAACSKPAAEAENAADNAVVQADAAGDNAMGAAAGATDGVTAPGGAVSPPAANAAVDTAADADATTAAASNSFTEGQAKGHIENAGYTEVTGLAKGADGMWTAKAMKDGKAVDVALDFKGAVTAR